MNETTPRTHEVDEDSKLLKDDFALLFEKGREMHQQSFSSSMETILYYIVSDIEKR